MKNILLITVFITIVFGQELTDAFMQLKESDTENRKLNWPTLTQALNNLYKDVQVTSDIEDQNHQLKAGLIQKLIDLHDRTLYRIKVDIAKQNTKLQDELIPYRNELDDALKYRASILEQQKQDLQNNDVDFQKMKTSAKQEMDEVSDAILSIGEMRKTVKTILTSPPQSNSFVEIKSSLQQFHTQINQFAKQDSPFVALAASLSNLLELDFNERQVMKDLEALLDQFWINIIDYRIELVQQANRNLQLFEDRRQAVLADKETTIDLYNSKIESYNQLQDEISELETYLDERKGDQESSKTSQDFFKNSWTTNEGITMTVKKSLINKANTIQETFKAVGEGINFQEK